jgi:type I restriction enzyme R subunit
VLPDPEASKYLNDLKIVNFVKESARIRYRDDKLSIKDASKKVREIVEEYLISKGVDPKIPPIPLLEDDFIEKVKKEKTPKGKAQELKYAIIEYIDKHSEEDPEFYERFSDRLNRVLEEYKENWELLAKELEIIRNNIKRGREPEDTFGFEPKKEMPFLGLLKQEIYGRKPIKELSKEEINSLVELTRGIINIVKEKIQVVDFWESYQKQKSVKSDIISELIKNNTLFNKRNEIAQKLLELSYHIYGKNHAN